MTDPEETALLTTIAADRSEFTARLVYADWLDEHDRPMDAARQRVLADPQNDDLRRAFAKACPPSHHFLRDLVQVQLELEKIPGDHHSMSEGAFRNFDLIPDNPNNPAEVVAANECRMQFHRIDELRTRGREAIGKLASVLREKLSKPVTGAHPQIRTFAPWSWSVQPWAKNMSSIHGSAVNPTLLVRHGFVHHVFCNLDTWLAAADSLNDLEPVREVKVMGPIDAVTEKFTTSDHEKTHSVHFQLIHGTGPDARIARITEPTSFNANRIGAMVGGRDSKRYNALKLLKHLWPWITFDVTG